MTTEEHPLEPSKAALSAMIHYLRDIDRQNHKSIEKRLEQLEEEVISLRVELRKANSK